ncbi:EpsG family protein [Pseudomonas sp. 5P_5.1_Bac1]|uniref:EpsG family protein n=1 Tax=Pseudomonas sp. 5P_5.1_Bac1 TaxID=2971616 RepID=UPI0021C6E898|nr:EpsG family protein [Pseudomonas sp. 5P_5.1_Bac1]MCU1722223.1 EpsG family protein [Pseudomonas sp. 5P_5.1_Bac1]
MELASRFLDAYSLVFLAVWVGALLVWVCGGERSRLESVTYIVLSAVLIWFSATRYETGYDWPAYKEFYILLKQPSDKYDFEIGFLGLAHLFRAFDLEFIVFQGFVSALQVFLTTVFIRKLFGGLALLGLAVYYTVPDLYLINSFSLMRQGLALALFLCGAIYLIERRLFVALSLLLLATFFHTSSIFAVISLLLIRMVGVSYMVAVVSVAVVAVAYLLEINVPGVLLRALVQLEFFGKYAIYSNLDTPSSNAIYKILFVVLFLTLFVFSCYRRQCRKRINSYNREEKFLFDLSFFTVFLSFFFWAFPTFLSRFQAFFIFFLLFYVLRAFDSLRVANRLLLFSLVLAISASLYAKFVLTKISMVYFPYQSVFFDDIERRSTGAQRTEELYDELRWLWKGV